MEEQPAASSEDHRDWSSLPADLLKLILDRLRWSGHPSFAATCRHWRSAVSPFYPAWITPLLFSAANLGTTNIRYYSPYYDKNFEVDRHTLKVPPGAKICSATGRHLTMCTWQSSVVDVELVTGAVFKVPPMPHGVFQFVVVYDDDGGARRLFGIDAIFRPEIARAVQNSDGEWGDWDMAEYHPVGPLLRVSPVTNPVFHGGLLYLMYEDGKLAVYDPLNHNQGFEVLDKPENFGFKCEESYLLESDEGDLTVILVGRRGKPVVVKKLNEHTMEWENVESLQGRTVFTGTSTTMMKKKVNLIWMRDRVFLPRLYDWPETIHVDLVPRDDELAFVPKSPSRTDAMVSCDTYGANMWSYQLGQKEESSEFWGTETVDYCIWVDFGQ